VLANPARSAVRLFDERQRTETVVGAFGTRPGELVRPGGVAFAPDGTFYVADTGNARVQRFSGVGNFEAALQDSLREPRGLATSAAGELFVADAGRRSVHLFGPGGAHRAELHLRGYRPADVAAVGDTLWVLSVEPTALLRVRVLRGG
jgi:sugar lactone lactonase YvrE